MQMFAISLDEETLLAMAERFIVDYCATQLRMAKNTISGKNTPVFEMVTYRTIEQLREMLRALLREPLKDPFFRQKLNEYFERHPIPDIRTVGWKWAEETLVWES